MAISRKRKAGKNLIISSLAKLLVFILILAVSSFIYKKNLTSKSLAFRQFIDHALIRHFGAYTLFGTKPMTWIPMSFEPLSEQEKIDVWKTLSADQKRTHTVKDLSFPSYNAPKIWKEWMNIQSRFLGTRYRFLFDGEGTVYFIDVDLLCKVVAKHQELFASVLDKHVSSEEVLNAICNDSSPIWPKIQSSHLLTGLLLGFGLENARGFELLSKKQECLDSELSDPNCGRLILLDDLNLTDLPLPVFRVFQNGKNALKKFESERESILRKFGKENFYKACYIQLQQDSQRTELE